MHTCMQDYPVSLSYIRIGKHHHYTVCYALGPSNRNVSYAMIICIVGTMSQYVTPMK